jgi:translation elongation factor P/translation initiation factor 5A
MKPIYNTGDKVYLTNEEDFNDYEIVEISPVDDKKSNLVDNFNYKIKHVKGKETLIKGESEIFPITA